MQIYTLVRPAKMATVVEVDPDKERVRFKKVDEDSDPEQEMKDIDTADKFRNIVGR